ncbi:hypothetical protein FB451DRAFT_1412551 [Mycena latifolia]|nr:hypothetical protein FB451DRAFT_1412551 [Mycena latifolia]
MQFASFTRLAVLLAAFTLSARAAPAPNCGREACAIDPDGTEELIDRESQMDLSRAQASRKGSRGRRWILAVDLE